MNKASKLITVAAATLTLSIGHGQVIVSESFDYPLGTLDNKATNATGLTGNWQLAPNNGSAAAGSIVNNTLFNGGGISGYTIASTGTAFASTGNASATMTTPINFDVDGEHYFSYVLSRPSAEFDTGLIAGLYSSGSALWDPKMRLGQIVGFGTQFYAGNSSAQYFTWAATNEDFLVVGKITTSSGGADKIEGVMIKDGGSLGLTFDTNSGIVAASSAIAGTADTFGLWKFNTASNDVLISNFTIGQTYESVIAGAVTPVPEPSTYGLILAICSIGYIVIRRRRKA